jgi:hypothetical protein
MPTTPSAPTWDAMALAQQLQAIASQSQKLMQRFLSRQQDWGQVGMGDASAIGGCVCRIDDENGQRSFDGRSGAD